MTPDGCVNTGANGGSDVGGGGGGSAVSCGGKGADGGGGDGGGGYEWQKRDPRFASTERSLLWEVLPLTRHFHPSVSQFALALCNGEQIVYSGDPLRDFQLGAFLDKFVFKNPKLANRSAGGSIMQPAATAPSVGLTHPSALARLTSLPSDKVDAHELFFHTYFTARAKAKAAADRSKKKKKSHDEPPSNVPSTAPAADAHESDDDDSEDEFAQKLAEDLMHDELDDELDDFDDDVVDDEGGDFGGGDADEDEDIDEDYVGGGGADDDDDDDDGDRATAVKSAPQQTRKRSLGLKFADASDFAHILESASEMPDDDARFVRWQEGKGRDGKRQARAKRRKK